MKKVGKIIVELKGAWANASGKGAELKIMSKEAVEVIRLEQGEQIRLGKEEKPKGFFARLFN